MQVADRKERVRNLQEPSGNLHESDITNIYFPDEFLPFQISGDVVLMWFSCRFLAGFKHVLFCQQPE